MFTANTAPGLFAASGSGTGPAAAQLADGSPIGSGNPAAAGDVAVLYLSGGGGVTPAIPDGSAALANPPSIVTAPTSVDFGGVDGKTQFAGLTPGLAGLYQVNVSVPPGTGTGNVYVDVSTPDAYTSIATIAIFAAPSGGPGNSTSASRRLAARPGPDTWVLVSCRGWEKTALACYRASADAVCSAASQQASNAGQTSRSRKSRWVKPLSTRVRKHRGIV